MKLILHIGQSKTGTTALQNCFLKNKSALIEQGILYPDYYVGGMPLKTACHNSMAESLSGFLRHPNLTITEYFSQFEREAAEHKCHTILLSAESFFGAPFVWRFPSEDTFFKAYEEKLKLLKSLIKDYDTHIIAYMRPPEDWIESAIAHIIRYDGLLGQSLYKNDEQAFSLLSPHLNYPKLLTLWKNTLVPQKITMAPYARKNLVGNDIITDFFHRLDINTAHLNINRKKEIHSSLDRRYIEVKKELNKQPRTKNQERIIIQCLDQLTSRLDKIEKYQLNDDLKLKIKEHCAPCHDWMTKHYSQKGDCFFHPASKASNSTPIGASTNTEEAMKEFQNLYNSPPIKILRVKTRIKSIVRNKYPKIHTFIKNVHLKLMVK